MHPPVKRARCESIHTPNQPVKVAQNDLYTHLTQDERYQIAILAKANQGTNAIAKLMDRNKSTISRELLRNKGLRGYRKPTNSHSLAPKHAPMARELLWKLGLWWPTN